MDEEDQFMRMKSKKTHIMRCQVIKFKSNLTLEENEQLSLIFNRWTKF